MENRELINSVLSIFEEAESLAFEVIHDAFPIGAVVRQDGELGVAVVACRVSDYGPGTLNVMMENQNYYGWPSRGFRRQRLARRVAFVGRD